MTVKIKNQWINIDGDHVFAFEGMDEVTIGDTITVQNSSSKDYVITIDEMRRWYIGHSDYDRGTTLLRNAAEAAESYIHKKAISRRSWPSRKELRNV